MLIRAGSRPDVFDDFNQAAALQSGQMFCGSDQAWLMHKLGPDMPVWDDRDGVYWFGGKYRQLAGREKTRVLFFPGSLKPWSAVRLDRYVRANYRLDLKEAA